MRGLDHIAGKIIVGKHCAADRGHACLLYTSNLTVTKKDLGIKDEECGISHPIVIDGHIHDYNLELLGKDHKWLHRTLKQLGTQYKKVFLFSVDDAGNNNLILKEK